MFSSFSGTSRTQTLTKTLDMQYKDGALFNMNKRMCNSQYGGINPAFKIKEPIGNLYSCISGALTAPARK